MNVEIRWRGIQKSEALANYLVRRAHYALGKFSSHVRNVTVRLEDANGPRGGMDKVCKVEVTGEFGSQVIESRGLDFYTTADKVLQAAGRVTSKLIEKKHSHSVGAQPALI